MELSRRGLLRAGAGTAAASATAGCLDAIPFVGGPDVELGPVPDGADAVVRIDADDGLADEALRGIADVAFGDRNVRAAVDGFLGTGLVNGPTSIAEWESFSRSTYDLDPRAASTVTGFVMAAPDNPERTAVGTIVEADWSPTTVREGLDTAGLSVTERTVSGVTIWDIDGTPASVGVIEDGTYAVGIYGAVRLVASVVDGRTDPLGGTVEAAFAEADEGLVRFGVRAGPVVEVIVGLIPGEVELIREQLFAEIESVSGSISADGSDRVLSMKATADSESTAEDVQSAVEGVQSVGEYNTQGRLRTAIEALSATQEGNVVTISYRASVRELVAVAETITGQFF